MNGSYIKDNINVDPAVNPRAEKKVNFKRSFISFVSISQIANTKLINGMQKPERACATIQPCATA